MYSRTVHLASKDRSGHQWFKRQEESSGMVNEEPSIYTHITATEEEAQQRRQRQKHAQEENNEVTLTEEKNNRSD